MLTRRLACACGGALPYGPGTAMPPGVCEPVTPGMLMGTRMDEALEAGYRGCGSISSLLTLWRRRGYRRVGL